MIDRSTNSSRASRKQAAPAAPGTRDRLVFSAMNLFHTHGYQGTSIDQILAAAQANSGSLYHFFDTKEDLLLAVLDAYLEGLRPIVMDPAFARADDPIDRIFEVLKDYRERVRITDFHYTCPIGSLALEVGEESPRARAKISENFRQWCAAIEECLDAAGDRLAPAVDRRQLSTLVLSVMEGAVMQAKTHRTLEVFDAAIAQLENYIRGLDRGPNPTLLAAGSGNPGSSPKTRNPTSVRVVRIK